MKSIVLPDKLVLKLVDRAGNRLCIKNLLFTVRVFAVYKNDFHLGPFLTDENGVAEITKSDLLAEADAHYDSGLMDYRAIDSCKPEVSIEVMEAAEIERALESRSHVWTTLLKGESKRWASIDELRNVYRTAANKVFRAKPIKALWDGVATEYEYAVLVQPI